MGNTHLYVKTRQQIAQEYGISTRTLRRWLLKSDIKLPNRLLGPKEQIMIYEKFGDPNQDIQTRWTPLAGIVLVDGVLNCPVLTEFVPICTKLAKGFLHEKLNFIKDKFELNIFHFVMLLVQLFLWTNTDSINRKNIISWRKLPLFLQLFW